MSRTLIADNVHLICRVFFPRLQFASHCPAYGCSLRTSVLLYLRCHLLLDKGLSHIASQQALSRIVKTIESIVNPANIPHQPKGDIPSGGGRTVSLSSK